MELPKPKSKDYDFLRPLGKGGFGVVWLARHKKLQQLRAIKVLNLDSQPLVDTSFRKALGSLLDEARKMATLPKHAHRVIVYDVIDRRDSPLGDCFVVMEYVDGGALSAYSSAREPMGWKKATRYVTQIAEGLGDLHADGILHRDIKPDNMLLSKRDDFALLGDFGLAAHVDELSNEIIGTGRYMAPELFTGQTPSPESDIYALTASLCHLISGYAPGPRDDWRKVIENVNLPRKLRELIDVGLATEPEERPDLNVFIASLKEAFWSNITTPHRDRQRTNVDVDVALFAAKSATPQDFEPIDPKKELATSDLVRLQVSANVPGFVTVLAWDGPGSIQIIYPSDQRPKELSANQRVWVTFALLPPEGVERLVIVWSRNCVVGSREQWRRWLEDGPRFTRAIDVIETVEEELPAKGYRVVPIDITHHHPALT